jgi:two-component system cell cycle response regulator
MEPRSARILIVDDHEDNLELLGMGLEARGFRVEKASSGQEALDRVAENPPDLILLDIMMPDLDGIQVARQIKADDRLPFIPIIMQTALDTPDDRIEGFDAGADEYVTKPVNLAVLAARVRSLLRLKSSQDELKLANERLKLMSRTDSLTGLDNRGHLEERLVEMYEHSMRLHEPLSCVMCDLDHFKKVNDTHGHPAGDAVLRQVAAILRREAREIDRVGRYGGEEFMFLLPGTVLDAAVTFAERIRVAVEHHPFTFRDLTMSGTLSLGVAALPHPRVCGPDGLVKAADDALYAAKTLGRNRVVRFDSPEYNQRAAADT